MAIKGLPNYVWVYPGQKDPIDDTIAKTRYARNLLSEGEQKLSLRQAQRLQRGGAPYESTHPQEQRKKYKRRTKKGDYIRYGPFTDIKEAQQATAKDKDFKPDSPVMLQGKGPHKKNGSPPKGGIHYVTLTTRMPYSQLQKEMGRLEQGAPATNPFQARIDNNVSGFTKINQFYVYRKA